MRRLFVVVLGGFVLASNASAGGPTLVVGAAEDAVRQETLLGTQAKLSLLSLAGLQAVRVSSVWRPGLAAPTPEEQERLATVAGAAQLSGMRTYVAVHPASGSVTPLTNEDQADFAAYTAAIARRVPAIRSFVIGNEPNLNRFWAPQFGPDGSDAAAASYLATLARTYDALKAVSPRVVVIGGAVSPRGNDRPNGIRPTHSPTTFIQDLGTFYRLSGRTLPVMDQFAMHPYQDNSSMPPDVPHPNTTSIGIADYGKLVGLLAGAFDGTAQRGSKLPIVYGEFGVETTIPSQKARFYTGEEIEAVKPVDPQTQGTFYRQALKLTFCQPTVTAFLYFHAIDEGDLNRWQSGIYYADESAKPSLQAVRRAARDVRGAVIARCQDLALTPKPTVRFPRGAALQAVPLRVRLTCNIDCTYRVRLERRPQGSTTLSVRGRAQAGRRSTVILPPRRVAPGRYRLTVEAAAPVNTGPPAFVASATFRIK